MIKTHVLECAQYCVGGDHGCWLFYFIYVFRWTNDEQNIQNEEKKNYFFF